MAGAERPGKMTGAERRWWKEHGQELVDTMAAPFGPDVVGLLRDDTSYGVYGDHGGHQRQIQSIPMVFSWRGLQEGATLGTEIRSVDLLPTILGLLGIAPDPAHPLDGGAVPLPTED